MTNKDEYYMKRALELARKGEGATSPNPMVGALLVKSGRILAEGYHKKAGLPHAEIETLKRAKDKAKGATLYVNLEPCSHFGKTPPCADDIIKNGVKRVVMGMRDPNPLNCGKSIKKLRRNNIDIKCGVLEKESKALNRAFETYITKKRPYVTVKIAQSLDGKIATSSGCSKWITSEPSRKFVHRLRSRVDAVLVGINTVIKDDPLLTSRIKNPKRQPIRIVLDSSLKLPKDKRIVKDKTSKVIIATTKKGFKMKESLKLQKAGIEIVSFRRKEGRVDLRSLLRYLAHDGVSHLLIEGGGTVVAGFLKERLVDEIFMFISPKIIGGRDAVTSVEGRGIRYIDEAIEVEDIELKRLGRDILIKGNVYRHN